MADGKLVSDSKLLIIKSAFAFDVVKADIGNRWI
jgi:hypothetical protein